MTHHLIKILGLLPWWLMQTERFKASTHGVMLALFLGTRSAVWCLWWYSSFTGGIQRCFTAPLKRCFPVPGPKLVVFFYSLKRAMTELLVRKHPSCSMVKNSIFCAFQKKHSFYSSYLLQEVGPSESFWGTFLLFTFYCFGIRLFFNCKCR